MIIIMCLSTILNQLTHMHDQFKVSSTQFVIPNNGSQFQGIQNNASNQEAMICVGISFRQTQEPLKMIGYYNSIIMYAKMKQYAQTFLILSLERNHFESTIIDMWINAGHSRLHVLNQTKTNEFSTPFLSSIIEQVEHVCPRHILFVAYVNADILFDTTTQGLVLTLETLQNFVMNSTSEKRCMVTGKRNNQRLTGILNSDAINPKDSVQDAPFAQDYFFMTRNLINWTKVPTFVIGRPAYDNALVDWAYHNAFLIDATETILAVHQSTSDGDRASWQIKDPDMLYNTNLPDIVFDHGETHNAHARTRFVIDDSVSPYRKHVIIE